MSKDIIKNSLVQLFDEYSNDYKEKSIDDESNYLARWDTYRNNILNSSFTVENYVKDENSLVDFLLENVFCPFSARDKWQALIDHNGEEFEERGAPTSRKSLNQEEATNLFNDQILPLLHLAVAAFDEKGFQEKYIYRDRLLSSLKEYIKDKWVELKESVSKDKKICQLVKDEFKKITFNIDEAPAAAPPKIEDLIKKLNDIPTCDCAVSISRYRNILNNIKKWLAKPIGLNAINLILCTKYYNDFSGRAMINKIMILESARNVNVHKNLQYKLLNVSNPKKINLIYSKLTGGKDCGDAIIDNEGKTIFDKSVEIMNNAYEAFKEEPGIQSQLNMYALIWKKYGQSELENYISEETPNVIFYGSPGTGKTYLVKQSIAMMTNGDKSRVKDVQCHPGFGYEEFIEGIKPVGFTPNGIKLEIVNGAFKDLCIKAKQALLESEVNNEDPHEFFFVADEINRANLSAMFGETLSLLEADYRDYSFDEVGKPQSKTISTPLSTLIEAYINESVIKDDDAYPNCKAKIDKIKELAYECELYDSSNTSTKPQSVYKINEDSCVENEFEFDNGDKIDAANAKVRNVTFGVPRNIRFIGMMNDVDKSIDAFDLALRRRFKWIEKRCDYKALNRVLMSYTHPKRKDSGINNVKEYIYVCKKLNQYISDDLGFGNAYEFGHAYFMKITNYVSENKITQKNCEDLFEEHLKPVLKEYIRSFYEESRIEECIKSAKVVFTNGMGK